ncbi:MAG: heme exporter protein CcmB [Anaerolineales bacterium]
MNPKPRFTTGYLKVIVSVARKDLRAELRGREMLSSMFLFAVLAVVIFSFALELNANAREEAVAGVLWVAIIFSGILGLSRSMAIERDKGSLDALLLAPVQRSALFFGKMAANLLFTLIIGVLLLVLLTVLFNIVLLRAELLLILFGGSIGFTAAGTLLASISAYARAREALLPIMLLPVVLPIVLSAVRATNAILADQGFEEWFSWFQLLALVDVVFVLSTFFLFDYIVEE